ncbi:MAG TPA: MarR family transcriptional regulator [Bacilli bacterium]|nr:MarR family transcriptional regulator [Bacilli bacterium]
MDSDLKEQLARSMFRFKKAGIQFPTEYGVHTGEFFLMRRIARNAYASVADIHSRLFITKPAVSQMYNSLEKKGYIKREIDSNDRRKFVVTLTPQGHEVLQRMQEYFNKMLGEMISRFGENNTIELIELFNRFADISDQLNSEGLKENKKGDDQFD